MKRTPSLTDRPKSEREAHEINRLLSPAEVRRITGMSSTTLWRERRAGRFPRPITLSPNRKAFLMQDVEAWIRGRVAAAEARFGDRPFETATDVFRKSIGDTDQT